MSGTSMDGLDIAYSHFTNHNQRWKYSIKAASTIKYPKTWMKKLASAHKLSGQDFITLDMEYGAFLGEACKQFIKQHRLKVDFIASHGHTIFHQPRQRITYQIGNGNALYARCGIPVIYDFRNLDVQLGGEGAPLVPIGDRLLFDEYDVCLNLGGIANLSMEKEEGRIAYDVCFMNMGLNYLAEKAGKPFDQGGRIASRGTINSRMAAKLNKEYSMMRTKRPSLSREIFENRIKPILETTGISIEDKLCTFTDSSAREIASAIVSGKKNAKVLCTGGGTFNAFFVSCLLEHCGDGAGLIIPEEDVVKYKEALVFSFLGVLRFQRQVNCLKSVTGASRDSSCGVVVGM